MTFYVLWAIQKRLKAFAALDRRKTEISPFFLNEKNDNYFHNEK